MLRRLAADQSGFTIVEVLAASVILVVGLLGVLTLIDHATATTTSTKAREQGVALQRELVEAARSVAYRDLAPATVVAEIRKTPGFVDCGAAGAPSTGCSTMGSKGWTIVRRGITFHVTAGVCAVDSPNDGLGTHIPERDRKSVV
jgi:prepilin-type N-terminal cleavage/methylation domain-containing protein